MVKKYTLPKVSKEVCDAAGYEFLERLKEGPVKFSEYFQRKHVEIALENPFLAHYLMSIIADSFKNEAAKIGFIGGVVITYDTLKRQNEINSMEKGLKNKL